MAVDEIGFTFGSVIRLLVLTAQCRSEIGELQRLHLRKGAIEMLAAIYKTTVDHLSPLTSEILALLTDLPIWSVVICFRRTLG
jgi:hypothetical protein